MLTHSEFPRPENQLQVLKRYLHVLALLQNKKDGTKWNYSTLGTMLELDEGDREVTDKMIRDYLQNNLQKDLGIDIDTGKGRRKAHHLPAKGRSRGPLCPIRQEGRVPGQTVRLWIPLCLR